MGKIDPKCGAFTSENETEEEKEEFLFRFANVECLIQEETAIIKDSLQMYWKQMYIRVLKMRSCY